MTDEKKHEKIMDDVEPHIALANAIIMQACKDYRKTYRLHIRTYRPGDKPDEKLEELEKFFRSDWYRTLTSVDGEYLMKLIREDVLKNDTKGIRK